MTPIEVLDKMIERLKTKGWSTNGLVGDLGFKEAPLCVLNTLYAVQPADRDTRVDVANMIRQAVGGNHETSLGSWNDKQTSVEPIIAACEKAKELLK